jgi:DNA repair exonuclease SbcCD ATPase subunit
MAYPGSTIQQNYAESLTHGYLLWNIEKADAFDVEFVELPNPRPYVTVDWKGTLENTIVSAKSHPVKSRFRIKSNVKISQKDATSLISTLNKDQSATEVTFKIDNSFEADAFSTGQTTVMKADLRNPTVLSKLLREYYARANVTLTDVECGEIDKYIDHCLKSIVLEDTARNTRWSIRSLKFDNLFSYGEKNEINFDKLTGIVGIFGQNRIGKSSIPGALMYALHNSSDRGKLKNVHIVNVRKQYGYARIIITVDGTDYVLERQTTKRETKKNEIVAYTALNAYRVTDMGELIDLNGEQRIDTEKLIRSLIGTEDDFCVTSLSAQGEHNNVISMGSAHRKLILAKFLDLNVFDKLYEVARNDASVVKAQMKSSVKQEWDTLIKTSIATVKSKEKDVAAISEKIVGYRTRVDDLKEKVTKFSNVSPVSEEQVAEQQKSVSDLRSEISTLQTNLLKTRTDNAETIATLAKCDESISSVDITALRTKSTTLRKLESSVVELKHTFERAQDVLTRQRKSLETLADVPCGDAFPTCKFIHDAHDNKSKIGDQEAMVSASKLSYDTAEQSLQLFKNDKVDEQIDAYEKAMTLRTTLNDKKLKADLETVKLESTLSSKQIELTSATLRLEQLEKMLKNRDNEAVVALKSNISKLLRALEMLETNKMEAATTVGKLHERVEKLKTQAHEYEHQSRKHKMYELVSNAFSKRGIPTTVVNSQLPLINAEIAKILQGIVDFTIELEVDSDNNDLDIFINYGDSKRVIELGSGMEKMVSSIAIRVALTNVSALPKCNTLIIDEGFGALDDGGVEAVNKLLVALKDHYRSVIVITHVEGVKDIADNILEISKQEKDSHVVFA